jgi:hypothetical protein
MVIVDSSVWIDLFAGRTTPQIALLDDLADHETIGVGDLVVCEVLQGIRSQDQFDRFRRVLLGLPVFTIGGTHIAVAAAANYRALRQRGLTVRGTIDCLIATFCIERGHTLLHNDRDFDPFEQHLGLRVLR